MRCTWTSTSRVITLGLRLRGIDVLTAFEDNASTLDDPDLLDRANQLGRLLFTQDDDLLAEGARRQQLGIAFSGVVYGHQLRVSIGQCVSDLELLAKLGTPDDATNRVIFLPL